MMTLDEYMQKHGDEVIKDLLECVEALDVPEEYKKQMRSIIEDNDYDMIEHNYIILASIEADRIYKETKEKDL